MSQGVNKLQDVLNTDEAKYAERDTFLIQHPTDDRLFLRCYNKEDSSKDKDIIKRKWSPLNSIGTEENNNTIIRQYLFFGMYRDDGSPKWATIGMLPTAENNDKGDTAYAYIVNKDASEIVYLYKDDPDWKGSNNNDRFDIAASNGVLKFRNGRYFSGVNDESGVESGSVTNTESGALKCRFLKVKDLTVANFVIPNTGRQAADGSSEIIDFASLVSAEDKKDAIAHDFEQDNGPCPYNMITTEISGDENCTKYYGVDNVWPLTDGSKGELAPGADIILPVSTLPLLGEEYDINRHLDNKKFNFKVFYFTPEATAATETLTRYVKKGGNKATENATRKVLYDSVASKVCSYDDNILFEFKGPDGENTTCDQVINNAEKVIKTCISDKAVKMDDGKACSRINMGDTRWQSATDMYCKETENKTSDPRCKMYLAFDIANVDELCGSDETNWTDQCKEIMEAKKKANESYDKDKEDGVVLTGISKDQYINDSLSREFHEKWKSQHPDWKPEKFVLPDLNFCQQNIDVRKQNAAINAACEIENNKITGASTDDSSGAEIGTDGAADTPDTSDTSDSTTTTASPTVTTSAFSSSTTSSSTNNTIIGFLVMFCLIVSMLIGLVAVGMALR